MNQQRGPLLLILWAAILVSGGYASPIHQSDIHDDFAFHGTYAIYGSTSTDNWLGGTGDWSDLTFWSGGLPGIASDVYINTGNDLAYLDTNATIASLTLGGTTGSSELRSTSTTNYLTIAGALTINQTGTLSLLSGDTVAAASLSVSSGIINLNGGSTLQIYGDASNSGSIYVGYTSGGNNLTINGVLTNHGYLGVGNGSAIMGGLVNDGNINGSLTVDGNASNSGAISLGSGFLQVNGGTLSNSGSIYLSTGLLQVNGAVYNSGQVIQDFGSVAGHYWHADQRRIGKHHFLRRFRSTQRPRRREQCWTDRHRQLLLGRLERDKYKRHAEQHGYTFARGIRQHRHDRKHS